MRFLLDTNAILAVLGDAAPLRGSVEDLLNEPENEKIVSVVSFWEMTIKASLAKLRLMRSPGTVWSDFEREDVATILPIRPEHLELLGTLPLLHRDPFDRLIVAQAISENCALVSSDGRLDEYGVTRLW